MAKDRPVDDLLATDPRVGAVHHGDRSMPVVLAQAGDVGAGVLPARSEAAGAQWPVCPDRLGPDRRA